RDNCCYFEAYEIVLDQLRDYSFYKEDGAHPNSKAIEAVWHKFQEQFMDQYTNQIITDWTALQQLKAHRVLYPESREAKKFKSQVLQKEKEFFSKYPQFKDSTRS
ncbi:MAG: GSCFA domain-containing protein, partial [Flavobacteriia bacterium]